MAIMAKATNICTVTTQANKLVDTTIEPNHAWKPIKNTLKAVGQTVLRTIYNM
jgi:hypothetical protein